MRTTRAIASLLRSLMLGSAATTAATLVLAASVSGCKDESQPEYWVDKLDEPAWRARAVNRLSEMFEGIISRANKDLQAKEVQDFIAKTLDPLMKLYQEQYGMLDSKTRVSTIKLLADFRDKRTEPALKKAFEEFAKSPKTSRDETDIKWAAQAQEQLKLDSLQVPMLNAFLKLRTSSMLGGVSFRDLNEAIRVQPPVKEWVQPLIATLDAEIRPLNNKDKSTFEDARDQIVWQTTACEALGKIGDPAAVEPLFKVLLDPTKGDVAATALVALVKLGKPAAETAVKLLKSEHEKLQTYAARRVKEVSGQDIKGKPWVAMAARVLGTGSRPEAAPALIAAIQAETDEDMKTLLLNELSKVPGTAESKEAFKAAFNDVPLRSVPDLAEAAGRFCDPEMIPWLIETGGSLKGSPGDVDAAQAALVETALKLAKPSHMGEVKAAIGRFGADRAKSLFAKVEPLVESCKEDAACYVEAMTKMENQSEANQFVGIKAGYMVAVVGNEGTRDQLIEALAKIPNASLRHVSAQAIDHLTPKGSKPVAEKLMKIIEVNAKSPDKDKAAGDSTLRHVMYRLEARAG